MNKDAKGKDNLFNAYVGLRINGMTPEELLLIFSRKHIQLFESLFAKYWGAVTTV